MHNSYWYKAWFKILVSVSISTDGF